MAQNDILKRYLDAGMAFTQLSRERAEEFVKDLVKAGDVRRKEAEEVIETLLERSRKNTEDLVAMIRSEIADQLRNLGLEDLAKRAGLSSTVTNAAEKVDEAVENVAEVVDPGPVVAAKKAAKKDAAVKKAATAAAVKSPLVVPGVVKKPAAPKKLIVPPSAKAGGNAATAAVPAKKTGPAKKSAPKKS